MGAHAYHDELEGFDSRQIWHDNCEECEFRSQHLPSSIGYLDNNNLYRAIQRTKDWMNNKFDIIGIPSQTELPLLRLLEVFILLQECLSYISQTSITGKELSEMGGIPGVTVEDVEDFLKEIRR